MLNRLRRFMQGRYGVDELSFAFVGLFLILNIVTWLVSSPIITVVYIMLFGFFIYRMISRNIAARQRENYYFLKVWNPVKNFFRGIPPKIRDFRRYKYLTCKVCGKKMRVPRGKGKLIVTCPKCCNKIKTRS